MLIKPGPRPIILTRSECSDIRHYLRTHDCTPEFQRAARKLIDMSRSRWEWRRKRRAK